MFDLDWQVLENQSNPFKRTRSRDTGQRDSRLQWEAVSLDARAWSAKHFLLAGTLTNVTLANSALLSVERKERQQVEN